jgi:hypothetical protein
MDFGPILHVVHPSSSARLELRIDQSLRELVDRAVFDRRQVLSIQASSTGAPSSGANSLSGVFIYRRLHFNPPDMIVARIADQ